MMRERPSSVVELRARTTPDVPPFDGMAERCVIGAVLIDPTKIASVRAVLSPTHFFVAANRYVYETILALHDEGVGVDPITIGGRLAERGRLTEIGGHAEITRITNEAFVLDNISDYVTPIVGTWERRHLWEAHLRAAHSYRLGTDAPEDIESRLETARSRVAPITPAVVPWTTAAQRARRLGTMGRRLLTGLSTLDTNTRGGLPVGRVAVVGGAPGAGKTTLLVNLARRWAREGVLVGLLAADEDGEGLLIRFGQLGALNRDRLEAGEDEERGYLVTELEELPNFHVIDADDEPNATVEEVSARLATLRAPGQPSALLIDSVQTVRSTMSSVAPGPRERIDAIVAALKRAAKVDGHLVVATSELARGAYRSKNTADQSSDLSSFKESGGIEYGAAIALVLRSVAGDGDHVDVTVAKNRLGRKDAFRMRLDSRKAAFAEVAVDDSEADERTANARHRQLDADMIVIRNIMLANPGLAGIRALRTALRATESAMSHSRVDIAVARLGIDPEGVVTPGRAIENRGSEARPRWYLRPLPSAAESSQEVA